MTLRNSWPGPTGVTTTTDARYDLSGLLEATTAGVARTGLFPSNLSSVVTARSDMNVDIAAFQGAAVQFGGPVLIANDGTAQLPAVLVSPASGTNFYVVYVKQNEQTAPGTDANNLPVFGAALSTVSFAVARGTLPTGALELATVQVPASVSATNAVGVTITQTFTYTAAEGGVVPVRNSTELTAWTPADGSLAWQIDVGLLMVRSGGAWAPSIRTATYTFLSNGVPENTVITNAAITAVSAETTDSAFITATTGTAFTLKAGTYLFTAMLALGIATTGRTYIEIALSSAIARNNSSTGDDTVSTATQAVVTTGTVVTVRFLKTTGGTSNVTGRIVITKLA